MNNADSHTARTELAKTEACIPAHQRVESQPAPNPNQSGSCQRLSFPSDQMNNITLTQNVRPEKKSWRRTKLTASPARVSEQFPQQGDLSLSGPPPGQGAGGGARTRDRWVSADL
ncbi:hypothetical protein PoB_005015000 [Plakobranchus ocellatus]|uniref:Uncharacterized protein n=1 Tax=Plakobranchus ocellatus TaxID=259542 RepID=A0AAV4BWE2_9GAST|nr:hypothetical protein PoB_005015000 [Plakobranchus ocellatus]